MDITHTTIPGTAILHYCTTRSGQRFGVMVDNTNRRSLLIYSPTDPDVPEHSIVMDQDEADQVAEILHSRSILDRLTILERRFAEITGKSQ